MAQEKAAVYDCLDRSAATLSGASGAAPLEARNPSRKRSLLASMGAPKLTRVAAVPLLHGSKICGALWLEQDLPLETGPAHSGPILSASGAATATSLAPSLAQGTPTAAMHRTPSMLSDPRALQAFGFACSMCMLGAEGGHVGWVASALARLGCSDSLSTLTSQLCAAVAAHVLRRFVLEGQVIAALVPPGADAPQALLLLPQPATTGPGQANNNNNASADTAPSGECLGPAAAAAAAIAAAVATAGGGGGPPLATQLSVGSNGGGSSRALMGRSPGGGSVLQFAQQQLQQHLEAGGPAGGAPLSAGALASRRKLRPGGGQPWANGVVAGMVRDQHPERYLRLSLDLTSFRQRASVAAHVDIFRSPSVGPVASSRSIVIPLCNPDGHTGAVNPCGGTTPALHARAFPLQRSLLQAHLTALQQQKPQTFPQLSLSAGPQLSPQMSHPPQLKPQSQSQFPPGQDAGGKRQASGQGMWGGGASAASSGEAVLSATAVVEDTQLHVQNVHKPSSDLCMLMGLRRTTTGMVGTGGAFSGHHSMSNVPTVNGGGGGAVVSGSTVQAVGVPQSLVLLVLRLGDGGAVGLYVCFPRRLPGQLLEAVRASCQELVDEALEPLFRAKLRDRAIMPEYETLCNATPGSYAVVRSPSFSGAQLNPLTPTLPLVLPPLSAPYMTNSDMGVIGGEAVAITATHHAPELLSGLLSTGDMDVLLGVQGQGHGHGQEGAARQDGMAGAKRSLTCVARRSAAPFVTTTGTGTIGNGGGSVRRGSASNIARLALSLSLANRSVGGERRVGAATVTGSTTPAGGPVAASPSPSPSPMAAGGGGECVEPLYLSQLLQSTNDLTTSLGMGMGGPSSAQQQQLQQALLQLGGGGQHSGSCRSLALGLEQTGFTASIITVAGVDTAATARQQLDLLVSSIHATINTDPTAGAANACPLDDLDALELGDVLGQGGGGTVFRGKLGTLDVAVKLMELPSVDPSAAAAAQQQQGAKPPAPAGTQAPAPAAAGGGPPGGDASAATEKLCLNARREMLRNATELAVQSRVSHPNIVQIYATYNDVFMVPKRGQPGCPGSTYRLCPAAALSSLGNGSGHFSGGAEHPTNGDANRQVACVAAAFELCDGGSLGSALAARTFPRPASKHTAASSGSSHLRSAAQIVDMKGIYMTLLDVALALRHLHSLNLVHRDLKPANLLLKSNPRDYRGFTVKLADFGFVLHLAEMADDGSRFAVADQACGTVTHMAPEALLGKAKIDASVDVYAFGILMWEIFSGGLRPFPRLQPDKIPRAVYRGARPTFADDIPSTYRSLAVACWSADPHRRPRASDLVVMLNGLLQELEG